MSELECGHDIDRSAFGFPQLHFVRVTTIKGRGFYQYEAKCSKCGEKVLINLEKGEINGR